MKVVTGGLLIDGTGRDPVPNASLVIDDDGRIAEAGAVDSLPSGAEVVDVAGKTIMPGIIDCHAHLFVDVKPMHDQALEPMTLRTFQAAQNAKATLDAGVTSIRDPGGTPLGFKMAAEQGLFPSPRMRISVTVLSQTGGHADPLLPSGINQPLLPLGNPVEWPNGVCDGEAEVRKATRAMFRAGADFIKLCSTGGVLSASDEPGATQFTREEIAVMVYEAAAVGKVCAAHAQAREGIRNAVLAGVQSIEHAVYVDESICAEMKARGTFAVPTLVASLWVVRKAEQYPGSVLPQSLRKIQEIGPDHRAGFQMALESGVRIAFGTDSGVGPHGTNLEELRLMVEAGMTPMQALVSATKTASECVRMDADVGTLEPGKLADLLVVDGNPLEDISLMEDQSNLLMIMQGGRAHKDLVTAG